MNKVALVVMSLLLAACTPSATDTKDNYSLPLGLEDCSFHQLMSKYGGGITVVRCPNSSVTTRTSEKNPKTAIVVDGVEYVKVVK